MRALIVALAVVGCSSTSSDGEPTLSGPVVQFRQSSPIEVKPGDSPTLALQFTVADGHHIQANPAAQDTLIPAVAALERTAMVAFGAPVYPTPHTFKLEGSNWDLLVYSGDVTIEVPATVSKSMPTGEHTIEGTLSYQACNRRACLFPTEIPIQIALRVRP